MDLDDLEPKKTPKFQIGDDLSTLSVDELKELIASLKAEISRIDEEVKAKENSLNAADAVFKS